MTTATGETMDRAATKRRAPIAAITAFALITLIALGAGAYAFRAYDAVNAQSGTVAAQAATIAKLTSDQTALTAEKTALNDRLALCLATAARYKSYNSQNQAAMQQITAKWGINYSVPIKGILDSYTTANNMLDCN
ncbi:MULTISPECIES: hypothetical protein [unclassified Cryobacterium]|uniref:hypothetical protein n=1 Tax=unclassified Cryobacterium TaxID=2649013 RepID=UPI001069EC5B|nr:MULTISPECIES: hypothetical protein [unclassified Cryobacterium]TFB96516.1 hypothetical protein E3O39_10615 [Cryobacterium sp. MDB2-A-1]TFC12801.1 hypothetical protein E3O35_07780 [Cryobacterium sp. MDB2-A-2]